MQLAAVLRAIISQRLVRRCDGEGRVPAVEVMINTAFIRECVLVPEKTRSIRDAIAAGTSPYRLPTLAQSLLGQLHGGPGNYHNRPVTASHASDRTPRNDPVSSTPRNFLASES